MFRCIRNEPLRKDDRCPLFPATSDISTSKVSGIRLWLSGAKASAESAYPDKFRAVRSANVGHTDHQRPTGRRHSGRYRIRDSSGCLRRGVIGVTMTIDLFRGGRGCESRLGRTGKPGMTESSQPPSDVSVTTIIWNSPRAEESRKVYAETKVSGT